MVKNISYGTDGAQLLDLYLPGQEAFDVFVYFHGGGLTGGDKAEGAVLAEYLTERGIAVVSANYRMYPDALFPQFIDDAAEAVRWVFEYLGSYGSFQRVFVGGSSAGAYLSMMLCFDTRFLRAHGVDPARISGYVHNAGQPTAHFRVLQERELDPRRVIVDETAPLYFIGNEKSHPPMAVLVSDDDLPGRYEQTMLLMSALKHFGYGPCSLEVLPGPHCGYVEDLDPAGNSILGKLIYQFLEHIQEGS